MRLAEFEPLTEAEQAVIAGLGTGHVTVLGDGELPGEDAGEDRQVRASLIRWLALGAPGEHSVRLHEKGLRIAGALVVDERKPDFSQFDWQMPGLNLEGCVLPHDLFLCFSFFQHTPVLQGATLQSLYLGGSHFPGLDAERLNANGLVSLLDVTSKGETLLSHARLTAGLNCFRGKFENGGSSALTADGLVTESGADLVSAHVEGETSFILADIGGDLNCTDATFDNAKGDAFSADRLTVEGDFFLNSIQAYGKVRLPGARIGGNLSCGGGHFENVGKTALHVDDARVKGAFFWQEGSRAVGAIHLTAAEIGHINDDPACWPGRGDLLLDRCRYGAFTGTGVSGAERIRWLDLQAPARFGKDFWPQPWEQCAKVLREMGHAEDARQVLIAKEERQRRVKCEGAAARLSQIRKRIEKVDRKAPANDIDARLAARSGLVGAWLQLAVLRLRDGALGALIAYGHRPLRALWWLAGLWIFGAVLFGVAYGDGGFKPNNAFILAKEEWAQCEARSERLGDPSLTLSCWQEKDAAKGYPAFNPLLYSLHTLVPVVDLEVQDYWVPDERAAAWARFFLWVHIGMGWFLALLAVAGFSGLVQTKATEE